MKQVNHNGLRYYRFESLDCVNHGVFTRFGGVSRPPWESLNVGSTVGDNLEAVRENSRRLYAALSMNQNRAISSWLVHGADIIVAHTALKARSWLAKADGIITNQIDMPLSMRFADCVPLLYYDPVKRVVGIAHAGWRGTVAGVGGRVIQKMAEVYGSSPGDIRAGIGPGISQKHYQVGEEIVEVMAAQFGDEAQLIWRNPHDGTAYLDLWRANELDLRRAGVKYIEVAAICTYERVSEFFSHRAEKGRTGRFGVVISL